MKTVKLGEENVAEVILGQSPPSSAYNGTGHGLPFFQGKADFGLLHPIPRVWCDAGQKFAKAGDVLMSVRAPVGDVNVALGDCVIGRGIAAIRAGIRSDPWFLYFALAYSKPILESRATGSTFASVNKATLVDLDIPLPEMPEQVAIGSVLRLITEKIEQENVLITTAQDLKRAAMRELFTRGLRGEPQKETEIGPVPESWRVVSLSSIAQVRGGTSFPPALQGRTRGDLPFYKVSDMNLPGNEVEMRSAANWIDYRDLDELRAKPFPPETIIFPKVGGALHTNKKRLLASESMVDNNIMGITLCNRTLCISKYLFGWFQTINLSSIANAGPLPSINGSQLYELKLPLPDLDEQREIVAILDAIDRKIELHRKKRAVLEELFKALLHKLMTGEIRVDELDLSALQAHAGPLSPAAEPAV